MKARTFKASKINHVHPFIPILIIAKIRNPDKQKPISTLLQPDEDSRRGVVVDRDDISLRPHHHSSDWRTKIMELNPCTHQCRHFRVSESPQYSLSTRKTTTNTRLAAISKRIYCSKTFATMASRVYSSRAYIVPDSRLCNSRLGGGT